MGLFALVVYHFPLPAQATHPVEPPHKSVQQLSCHEVDREIQAQPPSSVRTQPHAYVVATVEHDCHVEA